MLQYGCWCQILKERLAGKGVPVDAYDRLCRDWQKCNEVRKFRRQKIYANSPVLPVLNGLTILQCAVMDYGNDSNTCNAATTLYEVSFSSITNRIVCDRTSDMCGKAICQCDERLGSATFLTIL